jgi:hypothetical protein
MADPAGAFIIQPGYKRLLVFMNRFQGKIFDPIFFLDFEVALGVAINRGFAGMRDLCHPDMTLAAVCFAMGRSGIFDFIDMKHLESVILFMPHQAGKPMTGKTAPLVKGKADRVGIRADPTDKHGQN